MGKSSTNGQFAIAMLINNQRVFLKAMDLRSISLIDRMNWRFQKAHWAAVAFSGSE